MSKITKISKKLCKDFVENEFVRHGCKVSLIPKKGNQSPEMFVTTSNSAKFKVLIKTSGSSDPVWILNENDEKLVADNFFYVLVNLPEKDNQPACYIVPSNVIAKSIGENDSNWHSYRKRNGEKRKKSGMRKFYDYENQYLNNWSPIFLN